MKKVFAFLLVVVLSLSFCMTAYAAEEKETETAEAETAMDSSQPRLMVMDYEVKDVKPNKKTNIKIKFKNYSSKKSVSNIKLSIADESGEIKPEGTGVQFVSRIKAGSTYTWETALTASPTAQIGEHKLTVTAEYEDKYYSAYSATDTLLVNVKQTVGLDYDGIVLPKKVTQDDTVTIEFNLMNTGKSKIRNARLTFDIDNIESGGTAFVGEIEAGENGTGTANLRVSKDYLGETKGIITLRYEDEFAKEYKTEIPVSTAITEKIEISEKEEEEEQSKYPLWWVFMLVGLAVGGGAGFAVPTIINANKQRKEDELRL